MVNVEYDPNTAGHADPMISDFDMFSSVSMAFGGGFISLIVGIVYAVMVKNIRVDANKFPETAKIAQLIATGADEFLQAEYLILIVFVIFVFVLIAILVSWQTGICFIVGAVLSGLCGYLGMKIATLANVRTTLACEGRNGLNNGLKVAFRSGAVMALTVVSTGLIGVAAMAVAFDDADNKTTWERVAGFAFGASTVALFARVGGGIYTKAADVGADLLGKVEEDMDEDSPDNPATIADNVGDNVGDVAGMGADLFESFTGSIIAAATLGANKYGFNGVALPFWIAGTGAICSIVGTFMVRASSSSDPNKDNSDEVLESLLGSIRFAIYGSSLFVIGATAFCVLACFGNCTVAWSLFGCVLIGLACGNLIGYFTEYATSYTYSPTQSIAFKSDTGPATVIIQGLGVGFLSTIPPVIFIVMSILGAYYLQGTYGIAIAAVGMLATLGVTLATDAYGPVADNAGGIAEMAPDNEVTEEVRNTTDALDALGNTTAATGKGFAIGSAVLTALALMSAYADATKLTEVDENGNAGVVNILDPVVLPGILIGALLPFVFAALTMLSVGFAAESIIWECRDQINKRWQAMTQGKADPGLDSQKCVRISTISSLREMIAPGALAVFTPMIVGTVLGARGLLGMLTGAIAAGFLLAVAMSNAGGAWDNAKKWVEKDNLGEGKGKKSDNHKAVVVGDTVGDPFKDTSGPALNILIKLMSIVSLVMAPTLKKEPWEYWWVGLIIFAILVIGYLILMFVNKTLWSEADRNKEIDAISKQRKAAQAKDAWKEEAKEEVKEQAQEEEAKEAHKDSEKLAIDPIGHVSAQEVEMAEVQQK